MAAFISARVTGLPAAIALMAETDKDAARALASAGRAAGRRARSLAAREMAGKLGVPQKIFRKRIAWYKRRNKRTHEQRVTLWGGIKRLPRAAEHARVRRALLDRVPGAFEIRALGRLAVVVRSGGKLRAAELPLRAALEDVLPRAAQAAITQQYIPTLIRDYNRRIARRTRR